MKTESPTCRLALDTSNHGKRALSFAFSTSPSSGSAVESGRMHRQTADIELLKHPAGTNADSLSRSYGISHPPARRSPWATDTIPEPPSGRTSVSALTHAIVHASDPPTHSVTDSPCPSASVTQRPALSKALLPLASDEMQPLSLQVCLPQSELSFSDR